MRRLNSDSPLFVTVAIVAVLAAGVLVAELGLDRPG